MDKYVISFSGGKGSAVSAILAIELGLDFDLVFADTGIEDEDLHRFNEDVAYCVGKPLISLSTGLTPWDVYLQKKYIGNTRTAHCSTVLKTDVVRKYIKDNCPDAILVLGMSLGEEDRVQRAAERWEPIRVQSLLIQQGLNGACDLDAKLAQHNIELPRLYGHGFPHNNCGGFCCKAGLKQFQTLLNTFPERYAYHEEEQERVMEAIGPTARPFLRWQVNGETLYLTMKEFRELSEKDIIEVKPYDYGGCGCFVDM